MEKTNAQIDGQQPANRKILWPFWIELVITAMIPFSILWRVVPNNVLNSSTFWSTLNTICFIASAMVFLLGIPAGIIGMIFAKRMGKLRITAKILSIVNLCAAALGIGILILIFCITVFGGGSV